MPAFNGEQLYGLKRLWTALKMGLNPALKGLPLKKKLALNYVSKESKLTKLGDRIFTNTFTPYYPSHAYDRFLTGRVVIDVQFLCSLTKVIANSSFYYVRLVFQA